MALCLLLLSRGLSGMTVGLLCGPALTVIHDRLVVLSKGDFEHYYGAQVDSFAVRFPASHQALLDIIHEYSTHEAFVPGIHSRSGLYSGKILQVFAARKKIYERLSRIIADMPSDSADLRRVLRLCANSFLVEQPSTNAKWWEILDYRVAQEALEAFPEQTPYNPHDLGQRSSVEDQIHRVQSMLAELRVAVLVPNLTHMNAHIPVFADRIRQNVFEALTREERQLEIDIVWGVTDAESPGRMAWGEVKAFLGPLVISVTPGTADARRWASTLAQMQRQKALAEITGLPVDHHLFLIHGVAADAKLALEAKGITVHGQVVEP